MCLNADLQGNTSRTREAEALKMVITMDTDE